MSRSPVISVTITADDKTGRGFKSAETHVEGFGSKVSGAGIAVGTFVGNIAAQWAPKVLDFGRELFSLGQDYELMGKKANTVFGEQVSGIRTWADQVNESFGMADEEVIGLAASMGDLLVPMGFTRDAAADLTTETLDAAGALAAWSAGKYDTAEVSDIMTKAMLGERDGLKALGISINQAEVDQRALTIAQADGRDEITEMDKALATQQLMLEKSADARAAWTDGTMDDVKAQNELTATWEDAKAEMAKGLLPMIQRATRFLVNDVIPGVRRTVATFREKWPEIRAAVEPVISWFRDTIADVVTVVTALWDQFGERIWQYTERTFNNIRQIIEGVMLVVRGIIDTVLGLLTGDWGKAWDGIKAIAEGVWKIIGGVVDQAINMIKTVIGVALDLIKDAWRTAWRWVRDRASELWGEIKSAVSRGVDAIVGFVKGIPGRIRDTVSNLWSGIKTGISGARDWVRDRVTNIVDYVKGIPGRIASTVGSLFSGIETAISGARDWVRDRVNDVVGYFVNLPGRMPSFGGMFDGIKGAFKAALNWVIGKWNDLEFTIGGQKIFGRELPGVTIGTPNLPMLGDGGIVRARAGGVLALLGEAGSDEAVIPLDGRHGGIGGGTLHLHLPRGTRPTDIEQALRDWERRNGPRAA